LKRGIFRRKFKNDIFLEFGQKLIGLGYKFQKIASIARAKSEKNVEK